MEFTLNSQKINPRPPFTERFLAAFVAVALLFGAATELSAQSATPSAEQLRMINQLPPAQREQALQALERMRRQGQSSQKSGTSSEQLSTLPEAATTRSQRATDAPSELRAEARSRLILNMVALPSLSPADLQHLRDDPALRRLEGSHYYELNDDGVLELPGLDAVPLLGLTESMIQSRLGAEPALRPFQISVSVLRQEPYGTDALMPFGYQVFQSADSGFEPVTTGPVPPDYVLGPGDTVRIQLFGNVNRTDELEVTREGQLNIPEIGPIAVAGLQFSEFRADLSRRVQELLIGTQVSVSLGQLRTIRVFVLGDVVRPGSYVVSSLATISSALYYGGGVSNIGSLRSVQLKRQGKQVATLDLYDFLLQGDTSADYRLLPGDVIFVPPVGATVGVSGAVRRPAIYELGRNANVGEVLEIAGGLLPEAYPNDAVIERVSDDRERVVVSLDAASDKGRSTKLRAGDTLMIPEVLQEFSESVDLQGHVQRTGRVEWRSGMRLTDLLPSARFLRSDSDTNYVLIRREDSQSRQIDILSTSLVEAWLEPGSLANVRLEPRDTVYVFNMAFDRQRIIQPLLDELELQSRRGEPHRVVNIGGPVRAPGRYPLEQGMRISDVIRAGGGLSESAYTLHAELTRYQVVGAEYRAADVIDVDLSAILAGDASADLLLSSHDFLKINSVPNWDTEWSVTLQGEIVYPGEYRIRRGETLKQVLERAGGLTQDAFPEGSVYLRESLRQREQEQINSLVSRLEADLASLSLQSVDTTGEETLSTGQALLSRMRDTQAVGRLVIDLEKVLADRGDRDQPVIELRDGDRLLIPRKPQVVTVIGEVQQTTSHLYRASLSRDDYLDLSGGVTRRADERLIYVVRANGAVVTGARSRWFGRTGGASIRPGDTIVVPIETDRIRPLTFWTNVSQIFYQSAIAIAAVRTFDN